MLIGHHARNGMTPSQISSQLRTTGHIEVLNNEVYYNWIILLADRLRMHHDPRVSAHLYVQICDELELLYHHIVPYSLAFVTKLGNEIAELWKAFVILVDPSFKTNNEKLELYAVIATGMGNGFPLRCLISGPGTSWFFCSRTESLLIFLSSIRKRIPALHSDFLFTDKESAQIPAIQRTFHIMPSLCLRYMKSTVKRKLAEITRI